ncbi:PatU [Pelatocladus sp. BLCC-F211]|uniref:PatU n=1 Tax=Pelatocladus sp. BLCC-F211 TaxID=3342752 RepID=UPI0035B8045A
MNSDSETLQKHLLSRLLTYPVGSREYKQVICKDTNGAENPLPATTEFTSGEQEGWKPHIYLLGEIPTVQERFQAVLKRRLKVEVEDHPPLFPWETQILDYPEYIGEPVTQLVPSWGWVAHQSKLNLPTLLPETIFRQLLDRCQALITSSLPLGAKLVQAVESFFPDESQVLNDLAGTIQLRANLRYGDTLNPMPNLDSDYSDLQPQQQMLVSLLAAQQVLESLTLPISITNPVLERQWLTSVGVLNLKVEYQSHGPVPKLVIRGDLPSKGVVKLQGNGSQAKAESSSPGCLSVELCCTQLNEAYTLMVDLKEIEQQPLLFVIIPTK